MCSSVNTTAFEISNFKSAHVQNYWQYGCDRKTVWRILICCRIDCVRMRVCVCFGCVCFSFSVYLPWHYDYCMRIFLTHLHTSSAFTTTQKIIHSDIFSAQCAQPTISICCKKYNVLLSVIVWIRNGNVGMSNDRHLTHILAASNDDGDKN